MYDTLDGEMWLAEPALAVDDRFSFYKSGEKNTAAPLLCTR